MSEKMEDKLRSKYTSTPIKPKAKMEVSINSVEDLKRKPKKSYTHVRVEDDIVDDFREYVRQNNLDTHGVIINFVLRQFLNDNFIKSS